MMKVLMSLVVNLFCGLIGAAAIILAIKFNPELLDTLNLSKKTETSKMSPFLEDSFEQSPDPFKQMEQMRGKFWNGFGNNTFDSLFDDFDSAHSFKGTNEITTREDDEYIYYEIEASNLDKTSLTTKVENGYLTITGKIEKNSSSDDENLGFQSMISSSFQRMFPLPAEVDETKVETYAEKEKIIVRFQKVST